jgi:hypothetical protein
MSKEQTCKMQRLFVVSVILLSAGLVSAQEPATARFEKVVNRMVAAINEANYPEIQRDFAKIMRDAFPLKECRQFFTDMTAQYGKIQKLDSPQFVPPDQAIFPAHLERGILDIKLVLDNRNKVIGLWFLPHTPDIPVPDKNITELSLPFKSRWFVGWGGDTKELNQHHHDVSNQRFAFDFLGVDENGKTRKGAGEGNEDYFAFGREILAPADGVVTEAIDGVRDNVPGAMNQYSALGNTVFIQHDEKEISVLAHLKQDSVKVKRGDKVKKGQIIGLCGNSGHSSEPHLHYHLQNTPIIQDGTGIKCYFQKVIVIRDGKKELKTNYSPVKDDIVAVE